MNDRLKYWIFAPQPDITTLELAEILTKASTLVGVIAARSDAELGRHFRPATPAEYNGGWKRWRSS